MTLADLPPPVAAPAADVRLPNTPFLPAFFDGACEGQSSRAHR